MINFIKHEEEFFGIFKLVSGDEVLAKAVITKDHNESLVFLQDPLMVEIVTNPISETKIARGMGFVKWQQLSDEDFYVLREKDVICVSTMSKNIKLLYQAFVMAEGGDPIDSKESGYRIDPDKTMGLVGDIEDYRSMFEKIYKTKKIP
jgi:hypothetical protein|tara:strand:- start:3715 stop:4158 length:444 start_codon:yes stop_codon:yes gene_type:complete